MKRFQEKGRFRGDCGTYTALQMAMFRAAGVPVIAQHISSKDGDYGHAYPAYFDFFLSRWRSRQKPREGDSKIVQYLYGKRPWHHALYEKERLQFGRDIGHVYSPRIFIPAGRIYDLHWKGWPLAHFERIFFDPQKEIPSRYFEGALAPDRFPDTDDDGIVDAQERELSLLIDSPDSDGDGLSDLWEIEHGFLPNDSSRPAPSDYVGPAMDGLVREEARRMRLPSAQDPRGDVKSDLEVYDIESLHAKAVGENLYLAVTFYNDIRKNRVRTFTFDITARGADTKRYWLQ